MTVQIGIDVGGTFTDLFALEPESGRTIVAKAPSSRDIVSGVIAVLETSGIPFADIQFITHGSTVATNALVQQRNAPVGLLVTAGFRDVPETRRLWREHLFGNFWDRPPALVRRKLRREIPERVDRGGRVLVPLDDDAVRREVLFLRDHGVQSIAICFLFSFLNPDHERQAEAIAREVYPDAFITLSYDVNPEIKEYERMSTTLVAASLKPVVDDYLAKLEDRLRQEGITSPIHIMKSNAGIMSAGAARRKPAEVIKSGPAGGIASSRFYGALLGEPNLITIDIGGTTADVGLVREGQASVVHGEDLAWDIPVRVPMVDLKSIGAGGGSIAWRDRAGVLHVGPQSAGADPGPVCYGRGGREPTVTDAAITAGLLDPAYFLGGTIPLDAEAARRSIRDRVACHFGWSEMEAAAGLLHITVSNMAELVRELTINRGYDPRDFALMAFGGAGPLFAAMLAAEVGLQRVYIPRDPGVFSAWGGLFSDIVHDYARSYSGLLGSLDLDALRSLAELMRGEAARDFVGDGVSLDGPRAEYRYDLDLRYRGQSHELTVPVGRNRMTAPGLREVGEQFALIHEQFYGHSRPEDPIEVTTLRLRAAWLTEKVSADRLRTPEADGADPQAKGARTAYFYGRGEIPAVPVYERSGLPRAFTRPGPLIVEEPQSTTVIPPGLRLLVGSTGEMLITRDEEGG